MDGVDGVDEVDGFVFGLSAFANERTGYGGWTEDEDEVRAQHAAPLRINRPFDSPMGLPQRGILAVGFIPRRR